MSKSGLIPAQAFEHERAYLVQLSPHLPPPYCAHERDTDQYGYAAFEGNYYWVPGSRRETVKLLQYAERLKIYQQRVCVPEYPLPPQGAKNRRFSPEGQPLPRHMPKSCRHSSQLEEQRLRALGAEVVAYLVYALQTPGLQRHRFLRALWTLSRRVPPGVFLETMQRALRYRAVERETLERVAWFCLSQGEHPLPDVEVDESYRQRPAYEEGCLTDEPDLSRYDAPSPAAEPAEPADPNLPPEAAADEDDDTNPVESVAAWGTFKQDTINVSQAGSLQAKAVMLMDRAGYK